MRHIDLFSGIGGFALAAREVWGDEYENVCFCEINKYAQAVLRKNFGKDAVIYGDIRGLTADAHGDRRAGRDQGVLATDTDEQAFRDAQDRDQSPRLYVDLLTGGFPCQPFSQAGKRKGTSDERHLWPEMLRVIREFRPTWVVAENVRGLLTIDGGLVFETCCSDLEREGYDVQPFVIPACAVNAPHRRDRVWIVAKSTSERSDTRRPERAGLEGRSASVVAGGDARDTKSPRLQGGVVGSRKVQHGGASAGSVSGHSWEQNWLEVATRFCGVDDGLPGEMDGATLTKAGHRVERLKALGNAIVPQVAVQLFRGLKKAQKLAEIMEAI